MTTVAPDCEIAVVGAGAVGLAIAHALTARGHDVLVLERHDLIASETSSRSSEVIHAGLYYAPGSWKAQLCVEGRKRLYAFAEKNSVCVRRIGKLVVATREADLATLATIEATARANDAGLVRRLTATEAQALEPQLRCLGALLSPETGVIDSHTYCQALEGHITSRSGQLILNTPVVAIRGRDGAFDIDVESGASSSKLTARQLVLAGGLSATDLGRMITYPRPYAVPQTALAKGHYFSLHGRAPFSHLIYPVPAGGGLGVHLTIDTAGAAKFGPDIEKVDKVDYGFADDNGARCRAFETCIRSYWPALPEGALTPAYTGIRPKLAGITGFADFAIHGAREHAIPGLVALYGIESPGLTASLAIGEHVAGMLEKTPSR